MSGNEVNKPRRDRKPNGRFELGNRVCELSPHNNKYKPEYCDMIIEHMTHGYSYESFAGRVGVARATIYLWENSHPEFKEAKEVGLSRSLFWWEAVMLDHIVHTQRGARVDPNMWKYNMTVRFPDKWREVTKQEVEADVKTSGDMTVTLNLNGG